MTQPSTIALNFGQLSLGGNQAIHVRQPKTTTPIAQQLTMASGLRVVVGQVVDRTDVALRFRHRNGDVDTFVLSRDDAAKLAKAIGDFL